MERQMIADILFHESAPVQYQGILVIRVNLQGVPDELEVHQQIRGEIKKTNIPLNLVKEIRVTND
jgi:hypothetical protein